MAAHRLSGSNPNPAYLQRVYARYLQLRRLAAIDHIWEATLWCERFQPIRLLLAGGGGGALYGGSRLARRVGLFEGRDQPSRLVFENE